MIFVRDNLFGYFNTVIAELIGILEASICKINKFIVNARYNFFLLSIKSPLSILHGYDIYVNQKSTLQFCTVCLNFNPEKAEWNNICHRCREVQQRLFCLHFREDLPIR